MYFKVIQNQTVIDVLQEVIYVKYQKRNGITLRCNSNDNPNGILSSDQQKTWHLEELTPFPVDGFDTVTIVEIDEETYKILKAALDENKEVIEPEPEPEPEEPEVEEPTEEEIVDANTLELVRSSKVSEMNKTCQAVIESGVDVQLSDGNTYHFSLTMTDQMNISSMYLKAVAGEEPLPYHADNEPCKFYSAADIITINTAMENAVIFHTTYFNSLKMYINSLSTITEIGAIFYGIEIPVEYQSEVLQTLYAQMAAVPAEESDAETTE